MKLKTPISIEITEQRVVGMPTFDHENKIVRIPVGVFTSDGLLVQRLDLNICDAVEVSRTDSSGNKEDSFERGECQKLIRNPSPRGFGDIFILTPFTSRTAYKNVRKALKADDEIAALEQAGVADGWLSEGGA